MNRDRGAIKWNALMLPEHVKLLREWKAEDEQVKKPELEEWELEELNDCLQQAIADRCRVTIKIWRHHQVYERGGKIERYQPAKQMLYFETGDAVRLDEIIGINLEAEEK